MKNTSSKGFTLVELLTAITIFLAVSSIVFGAAASLIRYQKQMITMQSMFNDGSYALEYMGRFIRMARRDADESCISLGRNYENPGANTANIRFLDYAGNCRRFFLSDGEIKEQTATGTVSLTSSGNDIENLSFLIVDESGKQPRVVISFRVSNVSSNTSFNLETLISQRNLNL
jgi:prepilin-type N-terminal cleavage/methylation domain-containing protein